MKPPNSTFQEALEKASHSIGFGVDEIKAALKAADKSLEHRALRKCLRNSEVIRAQLLVLQIMHSKPV